LLGAFGRDSLLSFARLEGDSMRPKERRDSGQTDLFRARLDQIVDMSQRLAKLGATKARATSRFYYRR
jgi:hypothetical protein